MYIGKTPTVGNFQVCDAISVVNGQAAYTLQVGGVNVAPESANHMLVSLNGILQKPGSSFTISGSTMTFASNLATGDVIDFVQILGNVLDLGQPSDDTVKTASLQANAVTAAKLNNDIVSGLTALGATPADTDEFLVSDAGTIKRVDYSYIKGGGITMADQWRVTANFTMSTSGLATITNFERNDNQFEKIGTGMTHSSGIFTFPETGIYLMLVQVGVRGNGTATSFASIHLQRTLNNSSYAYLGQSVQEIYNSSGYNAGFVQAMMDVTDTANQKVKLTQDAAAAVEMMGSTDDNRTSITFIRLGDT